MQQSKIRDAENWKLPLAFRSEFYKDAIMGTTENIFLAARITLGKTQGETARMLGVSTSTVCNWERGIASPPLTMLPILERTLGISAAQISKAFTPKKTKKRQKA